MIKMKDRQTYLILRYSTGLNKNCIHEHQEVLNELGYCWFGKIGNIPSNKILNAVFKEEHPMIVLYKKGAAFICEMETSSERKPQNGYPLYYDTEGVFPSIYFKLISMEVCDECLFHESIVCSTGNYVEDAIYHSRIPFMLCEYIDETTLEPLGINECRYQRDGFCSSRSSVNYNCLCSRPSSCEKQRR